jgi:hypothetical protein
MRPDLARASGWLSLAAAPTFAAMALATALQDAGAGVALCAGPGSPLGGMTVMYLLMSGVHLAPWLRLSSDRPPSSH